MQAIRGVAGNFEYCTYKFEDFLQIKLRLDDDRLPVILRWLLNRVVVAEEVDNDLSLMGTCSHNWGNCRRTNRHVKYTSTEIFVSD